VTWAVAAAFEAGLDALVVVAGAVDLAPALRPWSERLVLVENPRWASGQASSLWAGLDWCATRDFDAAAVGVGDQPLVPASAWAAVARSTLAPIVTATFGGRPRPPVRLHRSVWPLVAHEGDEGARELMRRRPDLVAELACEGDPADVDTVDDLRRHDIGAPPGVGSQRRTTSSER
jgi:molybdenum cofactor cytidylyltransferase